MSRGQDRSRNVVGYGQYIDQQIEKTGRQVKLTEIFGGVFLLCVGLLVFFLAAAIIDHWIVPLRSLGRWGLLLLLIAGLVTFVIFRLVPLIFRRVNPVYSAHTIERHAPAMKNSLVNHLVLRREGRGVSKGVLRAVEQQAAHRLSQAPVDSAVDRGRIIRLGYLLLALMAAAALYKFFSPKDPLTTMGRIAAPWADVDAPTRVIIEQVRPGDTSVYAGDKPVEVEATVRGLNRDEQVTLYWSTEDGRVERQPIPMRPANGGAAFRCLLPGENIGLRQDVRYFVAAGDARSPDFRIEVRTPPVITVKSVGYRYPAYTRKAAETRPGGDIHALAGTIVTLEAQANQEIKSAAIDLACDGTIDHLMQVAGQQATVSFPLVADRGGGPTSYCITMTNAQGDKNPQPLRYNLQIVADRPPTVRIIQPEAREVILPLNGSLPIVVEASDPDFALSSVHLSAAQQGSTSLILSEAVLSEEAKEFNSVESPFVFRPDSGQLRRPLKVGDVIGLWATARDNKHNLQGELEPNVAADGSAEQPRVVIRIVAPTESPGDKMQPKEDQKQPDDKKQPDPKGKEPPKDDKQAAKQGTKEPEKKQDGKQKEKGNEKQESGSGDNSKQGQKQPNEKEEGGGQGEPKKEQSDGGNGADMNQLFNELRREAEKEQKQSQKQDSSASSEKQKGAGGGSQSGAEEGPKDQGSEGGSGSNKRPGKKTQQRGAGDTPSEKIGDPMTEEGGTQPIGGANDKVGRNKTTNQKFEGSESSGGEDLPDVKTPPSNRSDSKPPTAKEKMKAKAADAASKQPNSDPKSNPEATGNTGTAPNTAVGEKKAAEKAKESGTKDAPPSVPQTKSGTSNNADNVENPNGTPKGLSDTKTKINNKEMPPDQHSGPKRVDKSPTSPSVDERESNSKLKSGTKDGEKSGGTSPGGGQPGKKKGTGAAGDSENANDGRGVGSGDGTGETGKTAGKKVKSDSPTGISGNERGSGSDTTSGGSNPGAAKAPPDRPAGGGSEDSGSAGGDGQRDPSGQHGDPQGFSSDGKRKFESTKVSDPDLEAAKKAAELVLKYIDSHADEEAFQEPRVIELANRLRAMRGAADKAGPEGDIARRQLRGLSQSFSTRGMRRDTGAGYSELRGVSELPGYSREYLERSGTRPPRKKVP